MKFLIQIIGGLSGIMVLSGCYEPAVYLVLVGILFALAEIIFLLEGE